VDICHTISLLSGVRLETACESTELDDRGYGQFLVGTLRRSIRFLVRSKVELCICYATQQDLVADLQKCRKTWMFVILDVQHRPTPCAADWIPSTPLLDCPPNPGSGDEERLHDMIGTCLSPSCRDLAYPLPSQLAFPGKFQNDLVSDPCLRDYSTAQEATVIRQQCLCFKIRSG